MNLTPRWVTFFSGSGWEAEHWSKVGDPKASDRFITDWAREKGWAVLTNDLDFPQILAHTLEAGPGVILLRGEPLTPETRGSELVRVLSKCSEELSRGASFPWIGVSFFEFVCCLCASSY